MAFVGRGINTVRTVGNQTASGNKTFTDRIDYKTKYNSSDLSTQDYGEINVIKDINDVHIGVTRIEDFNGILRHAIDARKVVNGSWVAGSTVAACINLLTNEIWGTAPASDIDGSIVTTVSKSKSANGFIKLGNGWIIQWGKNSTTDGWVSFPTAFANKCAAVIPTRISSGDAQMNIFQDAENTRFKAKIYGGYSSSAYFYWIAVGY